MALQTVPAAETWEQVYQAFTSINFTSFDYESVKESLLQYLQLSYAENFNDYIETSELIMIIDAFAVASEQLAYRIDMNTHESFITTAARKKNILKLAKLISYTAARNIPARGLVKITTISTTEQVVDSQGNNLANRTIYWNDPNNSLWKEQFYLIINSASTTEFGSPYKSFQVGDVAYQQYSFNNLLSSFSRGVYPYTVTQNTQTIPMEIVSSDLDSNGVFEKTPDNNAQFYFTYSNDGLGDSSDNTGFMLFTKQGSITTIPLSFTTSIPDQTIDVNLYNINNTDVWLNQVDTTGKTLAYWSQVDTTSSQNLYFNSNTATTKYQVAPLENDAIRLIFGDGNFAQIPMGNFQLWVRQSLISGSVIQANQISNQSMSFNYTAQDSTTQTISLTFSLTSSLQNSAASEDIEHIRTNAPSTYYSQSRMVNGQDYNTYPLKDSSILKLSAVNRTFAGQSTYASYTDATGGYQNIKIFGDDLSLYYSFDLDSVVSNSSARILIDQVIEPLLSSSAIVNLVTYVMSQDSQLQNIVSSPRTAFIEDSSLGVQEKTMIQGLLDRHYYGEPESYVMINGTQYANVSNDTDYLIWNNTIPRTLDGTTPYDNGIPSGLQPIAAQTLFGLGYNAEVGMAGDGSIINLVKTASAPQETWTIKYINENQSSNTFSVIGSISGQQANAEIGKAYSNGFISFTIQQGNTPFILGDAFVLDVTSTSISQRTFLFGGVSYSGINLNGAWYAVNGVLMNTTASFNNSYRTSTQAGFDRSWVFMIQAVTNTAGSILEWEIVYRNLSIHVESNTTNFWYNEGTTIIDSNTQQTVNDNIAILKSNLNKARTLALGQNINYNVVGPVLYNDGSVNLNCLEVNPVVGQTSTAQANAMLFSQFVNAGQKFTYTQNSPASTWTIAHNLGTTGPVLTYVLVSVSYYSPTVTIVDSNTVTISFADLNGNSLATTGIISVSNYDNVDYVYFTAPSTSNSTNVQTKIDPTPAIISSFSPGSLTSNDGLYTRTIGRSNLDFLWQHFSPDTNLIDPSTTNINDMYLLTQGYYTSMMEYIDGEITSLPSPPTPLQLRNSYSDLISAKMISDTVVMRSGKIKLLFGTLADPQLQATFMVIQSAGSTLTGDQVRAEILTVINTFFDINNWDFGDSFYATKLIGLIHQRLPQDVASVVLVPSFINNSFGSLLVVEAGDDEVLQSCATLANIQIVDSFSPAIIRQNIT